MNEQEVARFYASRGTDVIIIPPRNTFLNEITFGLSGAVLYLLKLCALKDVELCITEGLGATLASLLSRKKTVMVVIDFLPGDRVPWYLRWHRRIKMAALKNLATYVDRSYKISHRIPFLTEVLSFPFSTNTASRYRDEIAYIGVPTADHNLEELFRVATKHGIIVNVIGDSPYLDTLKLDAGPTVRFHGRQTDPATINRIFLRSFCGYAYYAEQSPAHYSWYGFPSKVSAYLNNAVPVITTDCADFCKAVQTENLGVVIKSSVEVEDAVLKLRADSASYIQSISRFRPAWNEQAYKQWDDLRKL